MIEPSTAEQATWSDVTRDHVRDLAAEIDRLGTLVIAAYAEGWGDATCQPMGFEANWQRSQTLTALHSEICSTISDAPQPKEGEW